MTLNPETLPVGWIALDIQGVVQQTNTLATKADIWHAELKVGRALADCLPSDDFVAWLSTHPTNAEPYILSTDEGQRWSFSMTHADRVEGLQLWLKDESELVTLREDISKMRADIERLDLAAQGANLGIWDFNPFEGKIIGNRTWATQKKLVPEELLADGSLFSEIVNGIEKWAALVHPDDLEQATQRIQDHLDGKTELYHAEFRVKCGDGSWKWILDQGKVFARNANGEPIRMNGIHVDIDKPKLLQQRLAEMRDKAEIANQAKSTFLANMSHELRTPLNAVLGYSQLMKNDMQLSPKYQEYLDIINRSGEHLLSLINDVLDMSKIDAGHNTAEQKWFNFREVVEEIRDLMQMKAQEKQLAFHCNISDAVPAYVLGDVVKTRQILINLLGNAIKFTHKGEVALAIACRELAENKQQFTIEISDSGIGIVQADINRIFEPFEQVTHETSQNGTGLGLSICRQFVSLLGGDLTVRSTLGKGSVFSLTLTMDTAAFVSTDKHTKRIKAKIIGLKHPELSPKILVAEDQVDNQRLLLTLLKDAGFKTNLAQNGEEAVALNQSWQPDFIWMDYRMPKLDGLQATKQIRRSSVNNQVKIAALTASVFNGEVEKIMQAGMDDFAKKPFVPQELFEIMAEHLDLEYSYESSQQKAKEVHTPISIPIDRHAIVSRLSEQTIENIIDAIDQGDQGYLTTLFDEVIEDSTHKQQLANMAEQYQFDQLYDLFHTDDEKT